MEGCGSILKAEIDAYLIATYGNADQDYILDEMGDHRTEE
jgi:hypothetical protein